MIAAKNRSWCFFLLLLATLIFLYLTRSIAIPFIVSFIIAYLLNPTIIKIQKKTTIRRHIITIGLFILIGCIFYQAIKLLKPLFTQQYQSLKLILPKYYQYAEEIYKLAKNKIQTDGASAKIFNQYLPTLGTKIILSGYNSILASSSVLLLTPFITFYLIKDWEKFTNTINSIIPNKYTNTTHAIFKDIDQMLASYLRGQLLIATILTILYSFSLKAIGLHYWLITGISNGIMIFIPYIGPLITLIITLILSFVQFGISTKILTVFITCICIQTIDLLFLTPKIIGKKTNMHPVIIMFALLSGNLLIGVWGLLLVMPISIIIKIILKYFISYYLAEEK